jgi:hypothetical protein
MREVPYPGSFAYLSALIYDCAWVLEEIHDRASGTGVLHEWMTIGGRH